ncbi:TRAP transporter small permease subunit [Limibacillus halophilus]|uniref:TRAP transporter small permease protein n=1 Tax=Limibacillus halophilus TaxID=1579333 RepID=A0A839SUK9_9PROT|nr:TRAP transporter small permease subunit [Limibacillus halophilus]MBB3065699.1 TRAP-type mannitol/chloroaromatic compound transport system permease small subunit [Limibacillus halophilus]
MSVDLDATRPAAYADESYPSWVLLLRALTWSLTAVVLLFLINNYLIFWRGWPGVTGLMGDLGWLGADSKGKDLTGAPLFQASAQTLGYVLAVLGCSFYAFRSSRTRLRTDVERLSGVAAFIARAAFWSVLLIGLADAAISFLRVEGFLESVVGKGLSDSLGRPQFRGDYVHYPLIGASLVIAALTRGISFIWLATLVVFAELQIVVARFIFSYEQAFMGDLVRFWYAALFLFASAYTLIEGGHVRVDVLYTRFTPQRKGLVNALGALLLGIPLCWVILIRGMWEKSFIINSPLLSYEVTQSGFGMYSKYLMAGFLAIFAVTMMIQFASYLLEGVADARDEPGRRDLDSEAGH